MAFCTSCGATVQGAFCQQCGTPLSATAAQPAAPQAMPQAAPQAAYAAAAPVKGKISPIVWILLAVVGIIVLGIVAVVGAGLYVAKSVVSNPGLMMAKIITAANPDAEVLSTDPRSQTIRIRDRKTGEEFTLSFDDVKQGKLKISATGRNGEGIFPASAAELDSAETYCPISSGFSLFSLNSTHSVSAGNLTS